MTSHPSTTLPPMEGCAASGLWTYEAVEARLIEAMWVSRRMPDREGMWQSLRAYWPDIVRERCLGDYDAYGYLGNSSDLPEARISIPPAQMDRASVATDWLALLDDEASRLRVKLALEWKVGGRRVGWTRIGRIMGVKAGREAIKVKYIEAVAYITCRLNGKGEASWRAMARRQRVAKDRRAGADEAPTQGRLRGQRRRRIEVDVIYLD